MENTLENGRYLITEVPIGTPFEPPPPTGRRPWKLQSVEIVRVTALGIDRNMAFALWIKGEA